MPTEQSDPKPIISPARRLAFIVVMSMMMMLLLLLAILAYATFLELSERWSYETEIEGSPLVVRDSEIGYVPFSNGVSRRRNPHRGLDYHVYTDDRGARIAGPGQQSEPTVDVVTVGGSFTWGHGVESEQTFVSLIGEELGVSVANLSMGSYGTVQALQLLRRNLDLSPNLVIYGFIFSHLKRNLSPCAPSFFPFCDQVSYIDFDEAGDPYIHPPEFDFYSEDPAARYDDIARTPWGLKDIRLGLEILYYKLYRAWRYDETGNYDRLERRRASMTYLIDRLLDATREVAARLVIIYIPDLRRKNDLTEFAGPPIELTDALTEEILFVDLTDVVREYYENSAAPLLVFGKDDHPNEHGHALIAKEVLHALAAAELR